jgi:hypothetical protein
MELSGGASAASLTKEEFMQDLYAFWVQQGVHKSLKYEPNTAWAAPKLNGATTQGFGYSSLYDSLLSNRTIADITETWH